MSRVRMFLRDDHGSTKMISAENSWDAYAAGRSSHDRCAGSAAESRDVLLRAQGLKPAASELLRVLPTILDQFAIMLRIGLTELDAVGWFQEVLVAVPQEVRRGAGK